MIGYLEVLAVALISALIGVSFGYARGFRDGERMSSEHHRNPVYGVRK